MEGRNLLVTWVMVLASSLLLTGCWDDFLDKEAEEDAPAEVSRLHDGRSFTVADDDLVIEPLSFASVTYYGTYEGIQGEAAYAAEFPVEGWNGGLVMYTHGYAGEGEVLGGQQPNAAFRAAVLRAGYAWAASSYSANFYDVRAAIEDTNRLALELTDYLEADWGASYEDPTQVLISGFSMGGHAAAAAVERETIENARYQVEYAGALPFCQAEQNQFQWLGDYTRVAQELADFGETDHSEFQSLRPQILERLFVSTEGADAWQPLPGDGERLRDVAVKLTGGERPIFEEYGFREAELQQAVFDTGGRDGTINGILAGEIYDNTDRTYRWTTGDITSDEELFNDNFNRIERDPDANPLRDDGVRWLPLVQGDIDVPVLTLHTLGDFYVPFRHQQLYREAAIANGSDELLVQRAIRAAGHCEFSAREITTAMADFLRWVNEGEKPAGDDDAILDPDQLADQNFGCTFTENDLVAPRTALPDCTQEGDGGVL